MRIPRKRVRVALEHPIEVDGVRYATLRFRQMKVDDLVGLRWGNDPEDKAERGIAITARLCDVPEALIRALNSDDVERIGEVVKGCIGKVL